MSKAIHGKRVLNTEDSEMNMVSDHENHSETDESESEKVYDESESEGEENCYYEDIISNELTLSNLKIDNEIKRKVLHGDERLSFPKMTRYEMVRIIGEREKQLTMGAKSFIKNKEDFNYEELAKEEFKNKLIPFKIIRHLPNNIKEEWSIDELEINHLINHLI